MIISFFWVARVQTPGLLFLPSNWIFSLCWLKKQAGKSFEMFIPRRTSFRYTFPLRQEGRPVSLSPFSGWSEILISTGTFLSLRELMARGPQRRAQSATALHALALG